MSEMLDAALSYIGRGFKVFPVKPDKKPLTPHGLKDATQTKAGVREYWTRWPDAGIALVTDGLIVLDFDAKSGGLESKDAMEKRYVYCRLPGRTGQAEAANTGFTEIPMGPTLEIRSPLADSEVWIFEQMGATSSCPQAGMRVVENTKSPTAAK